MHNTPIAFRFDQKTRAAFETLRAKLAAKAPVNVKQIDVIRYALQAGIEKIDASHPDLPATSTDAKSPDKSRD